MSQQALKVFLEKLHDELLQKNDEYRREVADVRQHKFTLNAADLGQEVIKSLKTHKVGKELSNFDITQDIEMAAVRGAVGFTRKLSTSLISLSKQPDILFNSRASDLSNPAEIVFVFQTKAGARNSKYLNQRWVNDPDATFDRIKLAYEEPMKAYFAELKEALEATGQDLKGKSGDILNLSHALQKGVLETQMADAFNSALQDYSATAGAVPASIDADLRRLGIDLSIRRIDATDTMEVFLGATGENAAEGQQSKKKASRERMMAQIQSILESNFSASASGPLNLAMLEGSDSPVARKRKQALRKTAEQFKNVKNATVTLDADTKLRKSSTKKVKKSTKVASKPGGGRMKKPRGVNPSTVGISRSTQNPLAFDPMMLISELNRRLPAAIIDNMGDPALNNQTGRFAASVRVVDVIQTPRGFPSIGYTYLRNYRTFEQGNKQGSVDRDPRKLIDKTIRELAVQYVVGRLFTRRV